MKDNFRKITDLLFKSIPFKFMNDKDQSIFNNFFQLFLQNIEKIREIYNSEKNTLTNYYKFNVNESNDQSLILFKLIIYIIKISPYFIISKHIESLYLNQRNKFNNFINKKNLSKLSELLINEFGDKYIFNESTLNKYIKSSINGTNNDDPLFIIINKIFLNSNINKKENSTVNKNPLVSSNPTINSSATTNASATSSATYSATINPSSGANATSSANSTSSATINASATYSATSSATINAEENCNKLIQNIINLRNNSKFILNFCKIILNNKLQIPILTNNLIECLKKNTKLNNKKIDTYKVCVNNNITEDFINKLKNIINPLSDDKFEFVTNTSNIKTIPDAIEDIVKLYPFYLISNKINNLKYSDLSIKSKSIKIEQIIEAIITKLSNDLPLIQIISSNNIKKIIYNSLCINYKSTFSSYISKSISINMNQNANLNTNNPIFISIKKLLLNNTIKFNINLKYVKILSALKIIKNTNRKSTEESKINKSSISMEDIN